MAKENIAATITKTSAPITVERNGETLTLQQGDSIYATDVITTQGASAEIAFLDGAKAILSPNTTLAVQEYSFNDGGISSFVMELTTGAMRSVSGKVVEQNPDAFKLFTPHATVGIRGTDFGTKINEDNSETFILFSIDQGHNLVLTTHAGHQLSLTAPMEGAFIGVDGLGAIIPHVFTDEEIYDFLGFLFGISDEELIKQLHKQLLDEELNDLDDDSAQTLLLLDQNAAAKLAEGQTLDLSEHGEVTLTEVPLGDGESGLGSGDDVVLGSVDNDGGDDGDDSGVIAVPGGVSHYADAQFYNTAGTHTLIHHNFSIADDIQSGNVISGDAGSISAGNIIAGNDTISGGNITSGTVTGDAHTVSGGTVTAGGDNITLASKTGGASVYGDAYEVSGGTVDFGHDVISITGAFANTTIAGDASLIGAGATITSWGADRITVGTMDATTENTNIYGDSSTSTSLGAADTITVLGSMSATGEDTAGVQLTSAIHGGGGDDVITVGTLNANSTINGDDGHDAITVTTLNTGGAINGGAGNDTISVETAHGGTIDGGAGTNRLMWDTTITNIVEMGEVGSATISNIQEFGFSTLASSGTLNGTANADGIYIGTSQGGVINTDAGNDTVNISSAVNGSLTLHSDDADTLYLNNGIHSGKSVTLTGNGAFTVKQDASTNLHLTNGTLTLNEATTDITLAAMSGGVLYATTGDDSITVAGEMTNATIDLGEGENTLSVGSMSYFGTFIFGGDAKDAVTVTGNMGNGVIYAGKGHDAIHVKGSMNDGTIYGDHTFGGTNDGTNDGNDSITVDGAMGNGAIHTGNGTDAVSVGSLGNAYIYGGKDMDSVTVQGAMTAGKIDTYEGDDAIEITGEMSAGQIFSDGEKLDTGNHKGADTVTVGSMSGGSIYAGLGSDKIEITGEMSSGFLFSDYYYPYSDEDGDDTILIGSISGGNIDAGKGANTITIGSILGSNALIAAGSGNDAVTVNGEMSSGIIAVDDGANSISIDSLTGADARISAGVGADTVTVSSMSAGDIYLNAGDDSVTVTTMSGGTIDVGDGTNIIRIGTLSGGAIKGAGTTTTTVTNEVTTGTSTFTNDGISVQTLYLTNGIAGGTITLDSDYAGFTIDSAAGSLSGFEMQSGTLNASEHNDTINVGTMWRGTINAGNGRDVVSVGTMNDGTIYGDLTSASGGGADSITINEMAGGTIYTYAGNDTLEINTFGGTVHTGSGTDNINISGYIDSIASLINSSDTDILTFTDAMTGNTNGIDGGTLTLTGDGAFTLQSGFDIADSGTLTGNDATTSYAIDLLAGSLITGGNADSITVTTFQDSGSITSGDGNDTISVNVLNDKIKAGTGTNTIHVTGAVANRADIAANTEGGTDYYIFDSVSGAINGSTAADNITVTSMTGGTVNGGAGDDSITVGVGSVGAAGAPPAIEVLDGNDTVNISTFVNGSSITISGFSVANDVLQIGGIAFTATSQVTPVGAGAAISFEDFVNRGGGILTPDPTGNQLTINFTNVSTTSIDGGTETWLNYNEIDETTSPTSIITTAADDENISGSITADISADIKKANTGSYTVDFANDKLTGTILEGGKLYGDAETIEASVITNFGADTITLTGITNADSEIYGDAKQINDLAGTATFGADSITISGTMADGKIYGDVSNIGENVTATFGDDNITVGNLHGGEIHGDAGVVNNNDTSSFGNDIITITNMQNGIIYGDAEYGVTSTGQDTITINGTMSGGSIYGDGVNGALGAADHISVNTLTGGYISGGGGADNINITTMSGGTIYADEGIDTITVKVNNTGDAGNVTINIYDYIQDDVDVINFTQVDGTGHKVTVTSFTANEDKIFYGTTELTITSGMTEYTTTDGNLTIYFT